MTWVTKVGDAVTSATVAVYALLAVLYFVGGLPNKAMYWLGACILTFGVLRMS